MFSEKIINLTGWATLGLTLSTPGLVSTFFHKTYLYEPISSGSFSMPGVFSIFMHSSHESPCPKVTEILTKINSKLLDVHEIRLQFYLNYKDCRKYGLQ